MSGGKGFDMDETRILPADEMDRYRTTARRRAMQRRQAQADRRQRAWRVAHQAAAVLKTDYGAHQVVLFGSLARDEPFSPHSDIDLAVWGLDEQIYYRVVSKLLDLDPAISVDLLRAEEMATQFLDIVEAEGITL